MAEPVNPPRTDAGIEAALQGFDDGAAGGFDVLRDESWPHTAMQHAVAAYLSAADPSDVLRALLDAQPEKTVEALTEMLHLHALDPAMGWLDEVAESADAGELHKRDCEQDAVDLLAAAVASLKPKD